MPAQKQFPAFHSSAPRLSRARSELRPADVSAGAEWMPCHPVTGVPQTDAVFADTALRGVEKRDVPQTPVGEAGRREIRDWCPARAVVLGLVEVGPRREEPRPLWTRNGQVVVAHSEWCV